MDEQEQEEAARKIIGLVHGDPGPYFDNGSSYFGKKQTDPSMKDAGMETDCGGAVITRAKMTYGEADTVAAAVDLNDLMRFIGNPSASIPQVPKCYWNPKNGIAFMGEMMWAVYAYLTLNGVLKLPDPHGGLRAPDSYSNSYEYLYDLILKRLEADGFVVATGDERGQRRWYTWASPPTGAPSALDQAGGK